MTEQEKKSHDEHRMERIERYLENQFLVGQFIHIQQQETIAVEKLKRNPKDVNLMMKLNKLDNDKRIIEPRMREINAAIFRDLQSSINNGLTFKYFDLKAETKPAGPTIHVIGK